MAPSSSTLPIPTSQIWTWRGFPIRYQTAGTQGPVVLLIHGFGASSDHWRFNLPVLAQDHRVYALDLLGFGRSAKPRPGPLQEGKQAEYTFETWGDQILDFCEQICGEPAYAIGNSIGCVAILQAAVTRPEWISGVAMLNPSLRMLHERKRQQQPWYERWSAPVLQQILGIRPIGHFFFSQVAQPERVRQILKQAYLRSERVTDELVEIILGPAQEPGAADVFLAFVRYSQGPLVEDLLPQLQCPVLILWGEADPWEPISLGRQYGQFSTVEEFIPLPGLGHCPQDEAPEEVNPMLQSWLDRLGTATRAPI